MNVTTASTEGNGLLSGLPRRRREIFLSACEHVPLKVNDILGEPGERIRHVYFPTDGVVALMSGVDGRDALALALIGSEGMLGASVMLGVRLLPLRARVQETGSALRIKLADLKRTLLEAPLLKRELHDYLYSVLVQLGQTAACAVFHVVDLRIAYWLLMTHDRARADSFVLTHNTLARMLGVRRSGVTTAAGLLQDRNLISYTRGQVSILDREGLEHASCDCYWTARGTRGRIGRPITATAALQDARLARLA